MHYSLWHVCKYIHVTRIAITKSKSISGLKHRLEIIYTSSYSALNYCQNRMFLNPHPAAAPGFPRPAEGVGTPLISRLLG